MEKRKNRQESKDKKNFFPSKMCLKMEVLWRSLLGIPVTVQELQFKTQAKKLGPEKTISASPN